MSPFFICEVVMNRSIATVVMSLCLVVGAHAQGAFGDVTTSNDPAKAASIERHAAELKEARAQEVASSRHMASHHASHHAKAHSGHPTAAKS
jgi:hypothetical protein